MRRWAKSWARALGIFAGLHAKRVRAPTVAPASRNRAHRAPRPRRASPAQRIAEKDVTNLKFGAL
jgi:hypothetical protein